MSVEENPNIFVAFILGNLTKSLKKIRLVSASVEMLLEVKDKTISGHEREECVIPSPR